MRRIFAIGIFLAFASVAAAQISPDEAYKRLKAREAARKAAASQPSTQEASDGPSAIAAIHQFAQDADSAIRRDPKDKGAVESSFGFMRGKQYQFSGVVYGTTSSVPIGTSKHAIVVRFLLPVPESLDAEFRKEVKTVNDKADDDTKKENDEYRLVTEKYDRTTPATYKSRKELEHKNQLKSIQDARQAAIRDLRHTHPSPPEAEIYLIAPDDYIAKTNRGQSIGGTVIFTDAVAEAATWTGLGKQAVIYADKFEIVGQFKPQ